MTQPPEESSQPIDVLLVEDDPGDVVLTQEAFEDNKVRNSLTSWATAWRRWSFLRDGGRRART